MRKFLLFSAKKLALFILKRKGFLISNKGRDNFKLKLKAQYWTNCKNRKPLLSDQVQAKGGFLIDGGRKWRAEADSLLCYFC